MSDQLSIPDQLRECLDQIANVNPESVCVKISLPDNLQFIDHQAYVRTAKSICQRAQGYQLEVVPEVVISETLSAARSVKHAIDEMANFQLQSDLANQQNRFNQISTNARNQLQSQVPRLAALLPVLLAFQDSPAMLARKEAEEVASVVRWVSTEKEKFEKVIEVGTRLATNVGVNSHAAVFTGLAAQYKRSSTKWLVATYAFVTMAITAITLHLKYPPATAGGTHEWLPRIVERAAILSLAYFLVVMSSRNHRAHMHQTIVNEHRAKALETFQVFVQSSNDQDIRNAVLLETTRCIFGQAVSGYLGPEEQIQIPASDVLKSMISKD